MRTNGICLIKGNMTPKTGATFYLTNSKNGGKLSTNHTPESEPLRPPNSKFGPSLLISAINQYEGQAKEKKVICAVLAQRTFSKFINAIIFRRFRFAV